MSHGDASRGDSHETHCREVLAEVWLFLDHECDEARRQLLRRHLDECNPCLAAYGLEEKLKKLLARKCGGEQAPAELRARLREQLRAAVLTEMSKKTASVRRTEVTEVTVERGPDCAETRIELRDTRIERRP